MVAKKRGAPGLAYPSRLLHRALGYALLKLLPALGIALAGVRVCTASGDALSLALVAGSTTGFVPLALGPRCGASKRHEDEDRNPSTHLVLHSMT